MVDLDRTKALIQEIVAAEGLELVDVEFKGSLNHRILRIYIDKPAGVTHADCQRVSEQVGTELDVEELIPGGYTLEVSSPGLTRKLTATRDFERSCGRLVKLQTKELVDGARNFRGVLAEFDGQVLSVALKSGKTVRIPLLLVSKANLDIDF
ncbi:MAG: ribosome maturation factor RimP [Acidobacteria bacterium]|nr:ribosome maturation factor RimP [Acidobacteriota bacterium]MCI0721064.1 ribosome maturation factor RimP [Acidobacteriota bacterium]